MLLLVVYAIAWLAVNSPAGRVWQAIRENERRVSVLGLNPYLYKLGAFVLSAFLASATGVVYLLLQGGANPQVTTADFTLALLVMVVLGGVGTLWGAVLGGVVYEYLDFRLVVAREHRHGAVAAGRAARAAVRAAVSARRAVHRARAVRAGRLGRAAAPPHRELRRSKRLAEGV